MTMFVNQHGCTACPRCRAKYRARFGNNVVCDDCGLIEPVTNQNFFDEDEKQEPTCR